MTAKEFFKQEWGTGFTSATLSEPNGLLELSMEDIYETMGRYKDYVDSDNKLKVLKKRPKREDYPVGIYGDIEYDAKIERYCTYLERKLKNQIPITNKQSA